MADDNTVDVQTETGQTQVDNNQTDTSGASSAETQNTDANDQTEHMIPISRFNQINDELKTLRAAQTKADKEREEADRAALEEQNNYKALHEKSESELTNLRAELEAERVQNIRNRVGSELGLPATLIPRLQGTTQEEIEEDAKQLLEGLPKPQAPNVGNTTGEGNAPANGAMSDVEKASMAATLGVLPQYID